MFERKMAHIERVVAKFPIEGKDRIELVQVQGWKIIAKKDEYAVGDLAVLIEVDSWVPNSLAPFLTREGKEPRMYRGILGERIRVMKMGGTISQGLLMSIDTVVNMFIGSKFDEGQEMGLLFVGQDVTELLGIIKWEPEPEKIPVNAKGNFPHFCPKTDQLRVQSFMDEIQRFLDNNPDETFVVEEKAEGSSTTIYFNDGEFGICSRNLSLKLDDPEVYQSSHFTKPAHVLGLREKLTNLGRNFAIQAETVGPAVQGNLYSLSDWEYRVFDMFDIDKQEYMTPEEAYVIADLLGMKTVPVLDINFNPRGMSVDDFLKHAYGMSQIGSRKDVLREGVVYKAKSGKRFTWKSVSPEYLIFRGY